MAAPIGVRYLGQSRGAHSARCGEPAGPWKGTHRLLAKQNTMGSPCASSLVPRYHIYGARVTKQYGINWRHNGGDDWRCFFSLSHNNNTSFVYLYKTHTHTLHSNTEHTESRTLASHHTIHMLVISYK